MTRWAFALYAAMILAIVAVANLGGTHAMFGWIDAVPYGDKLGHFVLMGGLAFLADRALGRRDFGRVPLGPALVLAVVIVEEASQIWLPTRTFDLLDLAADAAGIALFTLVSRHWRRVAAYKSP